MPTTCTAGIATFSWIDPKTGLPEVDKKGEPPAKIKRSDIMAGLLYRFSNFLEGEITVGPTGSIVRAAFTKDSDMYRGPSFAGLNSAPVGNIGRTVTTTTQAATFRQLVGCRTESPEKIGAGAGAVVGGGVGVYAGIKAGALVGSVGGPVGAFIGAVTLGTVGYFAGREVAEFATAFPPIWTELELTIAADGSVKGRVLSHSLFPSNSFYMIQGSRWDSSGDDDYIRTGSSYDGDQVRLKSWKDNGWGASKGTGARSGPTSGNPWGKSDPSKVLGTGEVPFPTPAGY
jgi:hypothetical protein